MNSTSFQSPRASLAVSILVVSENRRQKADTAKPDESSKRGRPEDANQPDLNVSTSTRIELARRWGQRTPLTCFDEGGCRRTQEKVGELACYHCHIHDQCATRNVDLPRVYNTISGTKRQLTSIAARSRSDWTKTIDHRSSRLTHPARKWSLSPQGAPKPPLSQDRWQGISISNGRS